MDLQLKDKIIVVTGGSKGIGLSITHVLIEEGAFPVIVTRNEASAQEVLKDIQARGGQAQYVIAELSRPEACENACRQIVKEFGKVDGLVNNAGVNDGIGLEHGSYEGFIESIKRNVAHYYLMAHLLLPELKKSKGAIVNIGSKTSVTGQGGTSGYAAANGGRNSLTREWAVELLPYGIRVNAIIVAECYTPLYAKWIKTLPNPEERLQEIIQKIPLEQRMTYPEEIANTAAFLLSEVSGHTTGQLLYVDGGYVHLDRAIT